MSVKKVTVEKKDLPPLTPNGEYLVRYRIISEDKNRTSHWSPIYTLDLRRVLKDVNDTGPDLIFAAANISTSSNLITKKNPFILGQMVMFSRLDVVGTDPNTQFGPLAAGVPYYVRPASADSFSLHVSLASALGETGPSGEIDFLSAGVGSAFTLTSNTKNLIRSVASTIEVNPQSIFIKWGTDNRAALYDIFSRFKISGVWGSYSYQGSTEKHDYSILQPTNGATEIEVVIQLAGIEKSVNNMLTISTGTKLLRATISGGSA